MFILPKIHLVNLEPCHCDISEVRPRRRDPRVAALVMLLRKEEKTISAKTSTSIAGFGTTC